MRHVRTLVIVGPTILFGSGLFGAVPIAGAAAAHAVFVQTNDPSANAVRVYDRASNGKLSFAASYATGGLGGSTIGAPTDALSSQGSLTSDAADDLLFAVNAGSDTVTVFTVSGDQLRRTQVIASGGDFPVSVTAEHGLVYVLNGGGDGSVSGYQVNGDQLVPISGSTRSLGLNNTSPPNFLSSPGQVTLSPSGGQLIIPTKSNGVIDVYLINPTGRPSDTPVQNPSAGAVPFTASFHASGHLIVAEAGGVAEGKGSVSSYVLNANSTLTTVSAAVANGQDRDLLGRVLARVPVCREHRQLLDERPEGSFTRQLFLGENLDAERLNASYDKGVLTLTIPVSEQAKPRCVKISAEPGQQPQPVGTSAGQPMSEQSTS